MVSPNAVNERLNLVARSSKREIPCSFTALTELMDHVRKCKVRVVADKWCQEEPHEPIGSNAVVNDGESVFGKGVRLDTTPDNVDSLGGTYECLERRVLEELVLGRLKGLVGPLCLLQQATKGGRQLWCVSSETLGSPVWGSATSELGLDGVILVVNEELSKNPDGLMGVRGVNKDQCDDIRAQRTV